MTNLNDALNNPLGTAAVSHETHGPVTEEKTQTKSLLRPPSAFLCLKHLRAIFDDL